MMYIPVLRTPLVVPGLALWPIEIELGASTCGNPNGPPRKVIWFV